MKTRGAQVITIIATLILGVVFIWWMNSLFNNSDFVRDLFCGNAAAAQPAAIGEVAPGSPQSLAASEQLFGRISMYIFAVVTVLQVFAFVLAFMVVNNIRSTITEPKLALKQLENADIFFDIPLYLGLFGTVLGVLVMNFSPQSSRLIAYSSTLIGILCSLFHRVAVLYPYRKKLLSGNEAR